MSATISFTKNLKLSKGQYAFYISSVDCFVSIALKSYLPKGATSLRHNFFSSAIKPDRDLLFGKHIKQMSLKLIMQPNKNFSGVKVSLIK